MPDELDPEVSPEEAGEVSPEPEVPVEPEVDAEFSFQGHKIRFSEAGECFIEKDGGCIGFPAGVLKSATDAKDFIGQREVEKGE